MLKPPNLSGTGVVTDTLDFVKNLWGAMSVPGSIPGMAAPTLSVEELDKKINDLKAVEAWLNLNMSMLRGSIQALEVQRGTIATLKAMGNTLSSAVRPNAEGGKGLEKSLLDAIPYASAFLFPNANPVPTTPEEMSATIAAQAHSVAPAEVAQRHEEDEGAASEDEKPAAGNDSANFGAQIAQASAWWGVLQEQFKQAVTSAIANTEAVANKSEANKAKPVSKAATKAKPRQARVSSKSGVASKPASKRVRKTS